MKKQNYALAPDWKEFELDKIRSLRTALGVQWVLNMKAGHEDVADEIQQLLTIVRQEIKEREAK